MTSAVLALAGLLLLVTPGLVPSADLWGGTMLEVQFKQRPDDGRLLSALQDAGFPQAATIWLPSVDKIGLAVVGDEAPERVRTAVQDVLGRLSPGAVVSQVRPVTEAAARHIRFGAFAAVALALAISALWTGIRFGSKFAMALLVGQLLNIAQAFGLIALAQVPFGVPSAWAIVLVTLASFLCAQLVFRRLALPNADGADVVRSARGWVLLTWGVTCLTAPTPLALWLASAAALGLCALSALYVVPALYRMLKGAQPSAAPAEAAR